MSAMMDGELNQFLWCANNRVDAKARQHDVSAHYIPLTVYTLEWDAHIDVVLIVCILGSVWLYACSFYVLLSFHYKENWQRTVEAGLIREKTCEYMRRNDIALQCKIFTLILFTFLRNITMLCIELNAVLRMHFRFMDS